jgi:hypothetical protein
MTITLELPSDLETVLQQKAQRQGVSMAEFLIDLARLEAEAPLYSHAEIDGFLEVDRLSPELSEKVQGLLGR